jgi:hypothetical protein
LKINPLEKQQQKMHDDIEDWVMKVLSKPEKVFANLPPCPFAKKAWMENKVDVKNFVSFEQLEEDIKNLKEVMIFRFGSIVAEDLEDIAKEYNKKYPNLLFLEEHPDLVETFDGLVVNQGTSMLIVQDRKELEDARKQLKKTGYYDNWSEELKDRILNR